VLLPGQVLDLELTLAHGGHGGVIFVVRIVEIESLPIFAVPLPVDILRGWLGSLGLLQATSNPDICVLVLK
jgi:hypothetical protein